jgi:hypothetical protein
MCALIEQRSACFQLSVLFDDEVVAYHLEGIGAVPVPFVDGAGVDLLSRVRVAAMHDDVLHFAGF